MQINVKIRFVREMTHKNRLHRTWPIQGCRREMYRNDTQFQSDRPRTNRVSITIFHELSFNFLNPIQQYIYDPLKYACICIIRLYWNINIDL